MSLLCNVRLYAVAALQMYRLYLSQNLYKHTASGL